MMELLCDDCGSHIGWIASDDDHSFIQCDCCHQQDLDDENTEEALNNIIGK